MKNNYIPVDIGNYFIVNGEFIEKTLYPEEKKRKTYDSN